MHPDNVDDDDPPPMPLYEVGQLGAFMAECTNLEELALDMPGLVLEMDEQRPLDECQAFTVRSIQSSMYSVS